jgi:hypothetical protein
MTHKLHDPSRPLGPDNPPMGYRLAEAGERTTEGYQWFGTKGVWIEGVYVDADVGAPFVGNGSGTVALRITAEPLPESIPSGASLVGIAGDHRDQPLYQSILDQIDAHDSATRGERADRIYAEAMRMIGGGK